MDCNDCRYGKKTLRINGTVIVCIKTKAVPEEICNDFKLTELMYTVNDLDTADLEYIKNQIKKESRNKGGIYANCTK